MTDYSALAKQYGGTSTVDYSTLAQKYGGKTVTPVSPTQTQNSPEQNGGITSIIPNALEQIGSTYSSYPSKIAMSISQGARDYNQPLGLNNLLSLTKVGLRIAGDTVGAVFAPIGGTISSILKGTGAQSLIDKAGEGIANATGLADNKAFQDFAMKHPQAADDFGRALNLILGVSGNENINLKKGATDFINNTKASLTEAPQETFTRNLDTAKEVLYPKFTAKEKANLPLKDVPGILGDKSVPDLESVPYIKPVLEAVANLPEDIQLSKRDTPSVVDSKLNQGISRLHQGTDSYLFEQKPNTIFTPKTFDESFSQRVLTPIAKEFGYKSPEVDAVSEAYGVFKNLIEDPDAHGVYKARQELQGVMKEKFPTAFKKSPLGLLLDSKAAARVDAFKAMRNFGNDFISEDLLKPNDPYRARLREESSLITAKEQYRTRNTDQIGKNPVDRFLNRNPKTKAVVKFGASLLKLGGALDATKYL